VAQLRESEAWPGAHQTEEAGPPAMAGGSSKDTRCSCAVSEPLSHCAGELDAQCEDQIGLKLEMSASASGSETVVGVEMGSASKDLVVDIGGNAVSRIGNEDGAAAEGLDFRHSRTIGSVGGSEFPSGKKGSAADTVTSGRGLPVEGGGAEVPSSFDSRPASMNAAEQTAATARGVNPSTHCISSPIRCWGLVSGGGPHRTTGHVLRTMGAWV
jgi:hypothetical protein